MCIRDRIKVAMTVTAGFDLDALEAAIAAGPRVVFLSSPWNPVGPALSAAALQRLVAAVRPGTLFVLDEAYFEYADAGLPDGIEVLRDSKIAYICLLYTSRCV